MPLAKPGMLQADITRSVFTFTAVGGGLIAIAHLMNLCHEQLLTIMGGMPEVIVIVAVCQGHYTLCSQAVT